jgi:MtaA/CmuA family methyltransferase
MTGLERIQRAVRFQPADRVPVAPLLGAHAIALAAVPHDRACQDARAQAEALLHAVETYHPDGVFTLMDLSAEPEALGAEVRISTDSPPVVIRYLSRQQIETRALEERILTARIPVFVETVARLREALGDSLLIGALISGPLTAASNAVSIQVLARMLRREREFVGDLLDRISCACSALLRSYAQAGAHAIVVLEPVATSAILGPKDLRSILLPRLRHIAQAAEHASLMSVLHICGDCRLSLPLLSMSGFDAVSLDAPVELPLAQQTVGTRVALMGNLDVRRLLPHGKPEEVREAATALIGQMERTNGFVLSTGCELPANTPAENVRQMVLSVHEVGV